MFRFSRFLLFSLSLVLLASFMPSSAAAKLDPVLKQRIEEVLKEALNGRDALAQGRALLALVELGDKSARRRAEEALAEENWGILRYALLISSQGRRPSKKFQPALLKALENTRTRPYAFSLLEELPKRTVDSALARALNREGSLRKEILDRMVDRGDKRALSILDKALKSKQPKVRADAMAVLPRVSGGEASPFLMRHASHKDPGVREVVMKSLLKSRDPKIIPFLTRLMRTNRSPRVRLEVANALAQRGERDLVLPVLKKAINDSNADLRVLALEGLATVGDRVTATSLRSTAVNPKENPRVAKAALAVLGGSGDVTHLDALRGALAGDHLHLRVGAVVAMGNLKRREAIPDLARALFDGNVSVRDAAAIALGKVGGADVVPHLQRAVDRETKVEVRRHIIEALGRSGDPSGVMALQVLLVSNDADVKAGAVDAMLEIGDPAAVNNLTVVVDPRFTGVMEKAIKAICLLDEAQGMIALTAHLQRLSLGLMHELHTEAGPRSVGFLARFLEDGRPDQRALAIELLLRRGEKGLGVVRTAATKNSDQSIRRIALAALSARGDEASLPAFVAGLKNADAGIKGVCLEGVARLLKGKSDDAVTISVTLMLDDRSPAVRVAAAHTLYRLSK